MKLLYRHYLRVSGDQVEIPKCMRGIVIPDDVIGQRAGIDDLVPVSKKLEYAFEFGEINVVHRILAPLLIELV